MTTSTSRIKRIGSHGSTSGNQGDKEQDNEDKETNPRDVGSYAGNPKKAERTRDQRDS
jgi:hypothetical protein